MKPFIIDGFRSLKMENASFQFYFPELRVFFNPQTNLRFKEFSVGMNTTFRIVFSPKEKWFAVAFQVLGLGVGFQWLPPEPLNKKAIK